jgi:F-type H+-transporting ATPase subunit b
MNLIYRLVGSEVADPTQTHHWLWPEKAEIIYGGIASVLVFSLLFKLAGPMAKKAFADRTARIQSEMDSAAAALATAHDEAARIRSALGNIEAERSKILAAADEQAGLVLRDGRARIVAEAQDLESKAAADIAAAAGRIQDEIKSEVARLSSAVVERVVKSAMDAAAQQAMVEDFINKVGAAR